MEPPRLGIDAVRALAIVSILKKKRFIARIFLNDQGLITRD
jgi:hypothetical protein